MAGVDFLREVLKDGGGVLRMSTWLPRPSTGRGAGCGCIRTTTLPGNESRRNRREVVFVHYACETG